MNNLGYIYWELIKFETWILKTIKRSRNLRVTDLSQADQDYYREIGRITIKCLNKFHLQNMHMLLCMTH